MDPTLIPAASARTDASRGALFEHLMRRARGLANDATLAALLAGWAMGRGVLPADLGLGREAFARLIERHFPNLDWRLPEASPQPRSAAAARSPEFDDLVRLLQAHADREIEASAEIALIVAHACLGVDHLWQDLGLASRAQLGALMQRNFPRLAARNDRDMKWKKFLYRQLCELEGLFICRSPSCELCSDHAECFGPER